MLIDVTTLADYLAKNEANEAVTSTLLTIATVGGQISNLLRRGALADILGDAGKDNVQGEAQQKLDVIANDLLLNALCANRHCAGVASEELEHSIPAHADGSLLVLFDPLDGSSNIAINMSVGTIFSILPHHKSGQATQDEDFLQAGTAQLAAGYLLYGSSTMLSLTLGNGVAMFTLDPTLGQFVQIRDNVQIAADTAEFAINASNERYWLPPMQRYIRELVAGDTGVRAKDYNMRWIAAMVGDIHRILCRGGIFTYPFDTKFANKAGKLRLMYEANPMSFIIEQAGGASTDAVTRIMDITPTHIHQRVPVVLGAKNEVAYVKALHEAFSEDK